MPSSVCTVLFSRDEPGSEEIAQALARTWGASLQCWLLADPIPPLPRAGPILWLGLADSSLDIRHAKLQAAAPQRVAFLLGTDPDDLRARSLRWLCLGGPKSEPRELGGHPWILLPDDMAALAGTHAEAIQGSRITPKQLCALADRRADYALVVGHGREDVLSFGARGLCGQASTGSSWVRCRPHSCSYSFPKSGAEALRAKVLLILSCNAARLGVGLMPPDCRLALRAARNCAAVVAPRRLFTLSANLVRLMDAACHRGCSAAEIAELANEYQSSRHGERDVFTVLGLPWLRAGAPRPELKALTADIPTARSAWAEIDRQQRILDYLLQLALVSDSCARVSHLVQRIIATGIADAAAISVGAQATDVLLELAAYELQDRTEARPYWLSSTYVARVAGMEKSASCVACGQPAVWSSQLHQRHCHLNRSRLTCLRCGVVLDRPSGAAWRKLRWTQGGSNLRKLPLSSRLCLNLETPASPQFPLWVSIGINGSARDSFNVQGGSIQRLFGKHTKLEIWFPKPRPGTYFVKAYVLGPSGIAELAFPWQLEGASKGKSAVL